ncbi:PREDICTED: protein ANTI-SILENCING 1-like isoform X2 [Lupinus angustifolius]|uniref:protein ANTI-SILENCING 1-like isoform X2 n=1 Tax=Lupinus angustifolius TaxID=3871 RepID=UPI00092E5142|nr:PREDICTED: protein ANTI-SILENCING 1-like isoform X2 [Lupinus angustifolius]XP_019438389.1 PREDICTED: protein ANTI-SILENCING 1-like isoform X2 [Lupinus angustifolius]
MVEGGNAEELEFEWGIKGKRGGKKKDVQFYESFRYDGVDYKRYDSVYLYKEGELDPFIGKIIKIWENADKSKKVKVLWFFRSCEILNFLEGIDTLENELFLAYGDGLGLANINPLEAISGKCNVVCMAKDSRNPRLFDEIQSSEFIFYRFFDVEKCKILDKINDDKVADIEVKNIFNNLDSEKVFGVVTLDLDKKESSGNVMASNEVVDLPSQNNSQPIIGKVNGKGFDTLVRENVESKPLLGEKHVSLNGVTKTSEFSDKTIPQVEIKGNRVHKASLVMKKLSTKLYGATREITKTNDNRRNISIEKTPSWSKVDSKKGQAEIVGGLVGKINKELEKEKCCDSIQVSNEKLKSNFQSRRLVPNDGDMNKIDLPSSKVDSNNGEVNDVGRLVGKIHKGSVKENVENEKCCASIEVSNEKLKSNLQSQRIASNNGDVNKIAIPSSKVVSKKGEGKVVGSLVRKINKGSIEENGENKKCGDFNLQSQRLISNEDDAKKISQYSPKDKCKVQRVKDFCEVEEVPSKKLKLDQKPMKLSDDKLHKNPTASPNLEQKLNPFSKEVTRRPDTDRSRWFKGLPWEVRLKTAYEQGTLVLLENLDPSLTSGEVEDIVWNGFNESCTAKVIQRTALSSLHSGQAFVIFKKKIAAELVVKKLDEGCFLMSNERPLVGSTGRPCFPEKKPVFYGHHIVDQLRTQMQREMKDVVSTSHCSQSNNIEYEMALEWCLLQERADKAWSRLFKQQEEELRNVEAKMKSK